MPAQGPRPGPGGPSDLRGLDPRRDCRPRGKTPASSTPAAKPSLDDVSTDDIDSWLVGPNSPSNADLPTAVYGGDTLTISAFKDATGLAQASASSIGQRRRIRAPARRPGGRQDEPFDPDDDDETIAEGAAATVSEVHEEFIDESNPFYAAKKAQKLQAQQGPASPAKAAFKDTSDAAGDILRRLMEKRRGDRS